MLGIESFSKNENFISLFPTPRQSSEILSSPKYSASLIPSSSVSQVGIPSVTKIIFFTLSLTSSFINILASLMAAEILVLPDAVTLFNSDSIKSLSLPLIFLNTTLGKSLYVIKLKLSSSLLFFIKLSTAFLATLNLLPYSTLSSSITSVMDTLTSNTKHKSTPEFTFSFSIKSFLISSLGCTPTLTMIFFSSLSESKYGILAPVFITKSCI